MKNKLFTYTSFSLLSILYFSIILGAISGCAGITITRGSSNTNETDHLSKQKNTQQQKKTSHPKLTFTKNDDFIVLITKKGDTLNSLAKTYLNDATKSWVIADFNEITKIEPRREIIIPLKSYNNIGITKDGVQSIPILCYHRFGKGHTKLSVSKENFTQQMQYLKDNNFTVIPLNMLIDFLKNNKPLPKKSVVITIDDGYKSTYKIAYPILKSFKFPATLFLYTDFTGARDAISWKQAKEMIASGYIDIQSHSKTHPNMSLKNKNESDSQYKERMTMEIQVPETAITKRLKYTPSIFAYPYGDTNKTIINILKNRNYALAVTVHPGNITAFSPPYMLNRTMIFGDHTIKDFSSVLTIINKNMLTKAYSNK